MPGSERKDAVIEEYSNSPKYAMKGFLLKSKIRLIMLLAFIACGITGSRAQNVDIKTNLLYDATLTPNLGLEIGLAPKWSLDISGNLNAWTLDNGRRWKHWLVQPEARYWFCDRFSGHFLGFHALGGQYNFGGWNHGVNFLNNRFKELKDERHQGWYAGAGVAYGYTWILAKHWSLEAELGVGWAYTRYDVYPCAQCGTKLAEKRVHNYVGPTKAAINLIYVF